MKHPAFLGEIGVEASLSEDFAGDGLGSAAVAHSHLILPIDAEAFDAAIFRHSFLYGDVVKGSNIADF